MCIRDSTYCAIFAAGKLAGMAKKAYIWAVKVMDAAGTGSNSTEEAVALTKHAEKAGADGALVVTPYYKNVDSLYHYYEQVGSSVPEMPLLAYMFGGTVNAVSLMQKLMKIPTLAGAKYSGADMFEFRQLVELREENWTIFLEKR